MKLSQGCCILMAAANCSFVVAFSPISSTIQTQTTTRRIQTPLLSTPNDSWQGEVVPNEGGSIRGCSITPVGKDETINTEWEISIDGEEADLGRFSDAIYKKLTQDAKQQRFQGFRPGTIPPHIEPTYRTFAMDECVRETVLEALEQNSIRPFTDARTELIITQISIPPPPPSKRKGGRKKSGRKARAAAEAAAAKEAEEAAAAGAGSPPTQQQWLVFDGLKGAIDAGWRPGQSFSFKAKNVKGQKVLSSAADIQGAKPLGESYRKY